MVFLKTMFSHQICKIFKPDNHTSHLISKHPFYKYSNSHKYFTFSSLFQNPNSRSTPIEAEPDSSIHVIENCDDDDDDGVKKKEEKKKSLKPLDVFFREAIESCEKPEEMVSESEDEKIDSDVKKALRKLEKEVRKLKLESKPNSKESLKKVKIEDKRGDDLLNDNEAKPKSLSAFFKKKKGGESDVESSRREPIVMTKLSPDMLDFLSHLYKEGYFNDANFLPKRVFDVCCFDDVYGREYIKFAAEKFGKDNQEIAKWLSGSDVKTVALFGCPSLVKNTIFAAKRLRIFFKIQEDTVCSKCVLKHSCKFVNQSIWKGDTKNLHLVDVMKVITIYALEATPPLLVVPNEVKDSVSRLLKEALNLSQTVSR